MHLETEIPPDELPQGLSVPDTLHRQVLRSIRHAVRLVVERETSPSKFRKINAVELDERSEAVPVESPDEVAELLASVIAHDYERLETDETQRYRIRVLRKKGAESAQSRLLIDWDGEQPESPTYDRAESLEREVMMETIENLRRQLEGAHYHSTETNSQLLELAKTMREPIQTSAQLLHMAGAMMHNALQGQIQVWQQQYDARAVEITEREKTKRMDRWGARLAPFALKALNQFMVRWTGKPLLDEDEDEDVPAAKPTARPSSTSEQASDPPPTDSAAADDDDDDDVDDGEELAIIVQAFGLSLIPEQHRLVSEKMTKKAAQKLYRLLGARTDADVREAWEELEQHAGDLMALQKHLDPEQLKLFGALYQAIHSPEDEDSGPLR